MNGDGSHKTSCGQSENNGMLQFFCRHLVALCITYQQLNDKNKPINEVKFDATSGLIINIRGVYYFLTAGHILKNLEEALRSENVLIHGSVLADTFGPGAASSYPIPIDLLNEPKFYIDDEEEGLDFGIIMLRPYYIELLKKNGIVAIHEENWVKQGDLDFHGYAMLGFPREFVSTIQEKSKKNLQTVGVVSPTMIFFKKPSTPPENIKKTKYQRFIGEIRQDIPIDSIEGMSGGPIFGFNLNSPSRYWVVAIQSAWLKDRKITIGCPLPVLANLLTEWTDGILNEFPVNQ